MAEHTKIEWCDHTANLWWGCTEVHDGCDNCYARVLSQRWGFDIWGNDKPRRQIFSVFKDLARYQRNAEAGGAVHRVFVGSMMDIFEKDMVMTSDGWATTGSLREKLFNQIDTGAYPNLLFLFLTKRPSNISKYIPEGWLDNAPDNVMFGTSPVDQKTCDILIPQLLGSVRDRDDNKFFLSVEPMLGPIDLSNALYNGTYPDKGTSMRFANRISWVICGGESGPHKRYFNPDWARGIAYQCKTAGVPFFFKQIDKVQPIPEDLMIREFPILQQKLH